MALTGPHYVVTLIMNKNCGSLTTRVVHIKLLRFLQLPKFSTFGRIFTKLQQTNYGLTRVQAMKLAFEYASSNAKHIPNNWSRNNSDGKDWFRGFLLRNPEISLRTPEATSLSRATSFNKKNVGDFFENLKLVRERYEFEPLNIYNCDETGCTTVQDCPKVLASEKSKQVGQVTSAERGTLVTVCFAVNAIGNVMPPFFIFPRVKFRPDFVVGGPEGSDGDAYPTGWMTTKSFLKFMEHFKKYSRASKGNPVLLILDNHESHVSVDVVKFSKDNGITLLTLPPHCSNKLQPLDVAVYSSFKSRYNRVMNNWMLSNPGKTVTIYNIPGFIKTMMSQAFSQANILSGFKSSGINPFNPDIFGEEDFMCSAVTDRNLSNDELLPAIPSSSRQIQLSFSADRDQLSSLQHDLGGIPHSLSGDSESSLSIMQTEANVHQIPVTPQEQNNIVTDCIPPVNPKVAVVAESIISDQDKAYLKPILSTRQNQEREALPLHNQNDAGCRPGSSTIPKISLVTPETIRPYPKAAPRKTIRRGRQPGRTKILTQTPEKDATDDLTPKMNQKNKGKPNVDKTKKKILQSSESEAENDESTKNIAVKKKPMKGKPNKRNVQSKIRSANKKRRISKIKNRGQTTETETKSEDENVIPYADDSDDDYSEEDPDIDNRWYCFVCEREQVLSMRLCISCKRYVHEICVGLTKQDEERYICHECED